MTELGTTIDRRRTLAFAGSLMAFAGSEVHAFTRGNPSASTATQQSEQGNQGALPVQQIENALGTKGKMSNGVLSISIGRKDIGHVKGPMGVTFTPTFQIDHGFNLQLLSDGRAMMNGEMTVLPKEADAVISEILAQGLVFQALHQHFMNESPQVYHIHLRGVDDPTRVAQKLRKIVEKTGAPLPQQTPKHPTTPLNHNRLAQIIGGQATVDDEGMVHVEVPRAETIRLGGVAVNPYLGVLTHVNFMPMGNSKAAVAPDYAMLASEVDPVMSVALRHGFNIGCLYNQETDENPQLFFSHQVNVGDPEQLAHAVREALEKTNVRFVSRLAVGNQRTPGN